MSELASTPKPDLERMLDEAIMVLKRGTPNKKYWEQHKKAIQKELKTR